MERALSLEEVCKKIPALIETGEVECDGVAIYVKYPNIQIRQISLRPSLNKCSPNELRTIEEKILINDFLREHPDVVALHDFMKKRNKDVRNRLQNNNPEWLHDIQRMNQPHRARVQKFRDGLTGNRL